MKKFTNRGFTLIELLVVIAIIGILSSVVLASLSSARGKAQAVALRASLRALQAGIAMCDDDTTITALNTSGPICGSGATASATKLPTNTQLNSTTGTWTSAGSKGSHMITFVNTGHPVPNCNGTWAIDAASTTLGNTTPETACK